MAPTPPSAASARPPLLQVGVFVWLSSEVMFFAGLFGSYFTLRASAGESWPPAGAELDVWYAGAFTALLVLSSATLQIAERAGERVSPGIARRWLAITVLLAGVFLGGQAVEWMRADFSVSSHTFGSLFFTMTGFHGAHVLAGVLAMGVALGRTEPVHLGALSAYWHFVDVVWIAMFVTLYMVK